MLNQLIIFSHPWALKQHYDGRGTVFKTQARIEIEELGLRKTLIVAHEPHQICGYDVAHIHFIDHEPTEDMRTEAIRRVIRRNGTIMIFL